MSFHSNNEDFDDVTTEMGEREIYLDDPSHHGTFFSKYFFLAKMVS